MDTDTPSGFYHYYLWLCTSKGVSSYAAFHAMQINKGTIAKWRYAEEDGKDILPSTKIAIKLSEYFDIPADKILKMQDKYGLTQIDWSMMGVAFQTERLRLGKNIGDITKWSTLSDLELLNFEVGKAYIPYNQLAVICGVLGVSADSVFMPWIQQMHDYETERLTKDPIPVVEHTPVDLGDFMYTATDDSVNHVTKGDFIYLRAQVTAENNDLILVEVGGQRMVRRYEVINGTVLLKPENPKYQTLIFVGDEAKSIRIIGKATYFIVKVV